jgi:hypothetical protein
MYADVFSAEHNPNEKTTPQAAEAFAMPLAIDAGG